MSKSNEIFDNLNQVMLNALLQMRVLVESEVSHQTDFVSNVKLFLIGVISSAVDLAEVTTPGSSHYLYTEIEATAKHRGLRAVRDAQVKGSSYSVSNIEPDDFENAMNYIGQELSITLFKHIHDLPEPLRTPEMFLRRVEALLGNLLDQKFGKEMGQDPHKILDSLCEHVHLALTNLESRKIIH